MGLIADTKQALKGSPREIFNLNLLLYTWIFSFPGVSKGFDEGERLFPIMLPHLRTAFGYHAVKSSLANS